MAKIEHMQFKRSLLIHIGLRILSLPILAGIIYFLLENIETFRASGWGHSFFAAASILALTLMAEMILFFTKKKMEKLICNVAMLFALFLFVVIAIPFMG